MDNLDGGPLEAEEIVPSGRVQFGAGFPETPEPAMRRPTPEWFRNARAVQWKPPSYGDVPLWALSPNVAEAERIRRATLTRARPRRSRTRGSHLQRSPRRRSRLVSCSSSSSERGDPDPEPKLPAQRPNPIELSALVAPSLSPAQRAMIVLSLPIERWLS